MSYCKAIESMTGDRKALHKRYHDQYYGFPIRNDNELFGRLLMEFFQAGLSWETILKKENGFRLAFDNFNIVKVAAYDEVDFDRLVNDARIIRNKLKINAAIENARSIMLLQKEHGSFQNWLAINSPKQLDEWVKLFEKTFKFTGGEIVKEFLMSTGHLPGAHEANCAIHEYIIHSEPIWLLHIKK
jgi:DNA-3-methyladenine glycosylase I